jgi:hypothetical protein
LNLDITHIENIFKILHMCCNVGTGIAQSVWWPDHGLDNSGFVSWLVENIFFSSTVREWGGKGKAIPLQALRVPAG